MHFSSVNLADTSQSLVLRAVSHHPGQLGSSEQLASHTDPFIFPRCRLVTLKGRSLSMKAEQERHPAAAPLKCIFKQNWRQTFSASPWSCACKKTFMSQLPDIQKQRKKVFQWLKHSFHLCCVFFMQPTDFLTAFSKSHPQFSLFLWGLTSLFCFWTLHVNWDRSINFHEAIMFCVNPGSHSSALPFRHVLFTSTIFYSNIFFNLNSICTAYFYLHSK